MSSLFSASLLPWGIAACSLALLVATYAILAPGPVRLEPERRRPAVDPRVSRLASAATAVTRFADLLLRRGNTKTHAVLLERAGVTTSMAVLMALTGVGALVAAAHGLVLSGPPVAVLLAAVVPIAVRVALGVLAGRRRKAFADQLDDSLQLMASSLRAGHSMPQALASVAREAEKPTSVEFARIIDETRVGRPLTLALVETAARMQSDEFDWVAQAIAINRQVGGDLAEVLDGVGQTIRERGQIRRQVEALNAEAKLSAYVLMALPFGVGGFLTFANPEYMAEFTASPMGYGLIAAGVVLLVAGGLWLRKIVSFKF